MPRRVPDGGTEGRRDGASYNIWCPDVLLRLPAAARWLTIEPEVHGVVALGREAGEVLVVSEQMRQAHAGPRRDERVNVRLSPEDKVRLSAAARQAGMTLPAYLVHSGLHAGGFETPRERDAALYEVMKLEHQVARVGNNVNQIAHRLNALDEVDPGMKEAAAEVRRTMRAVQQLGLRIAEMRDQ